MTLTREQVETCRHFLEHEDGRGVYLPKYIAIGLCDLALQTIEPALAWQPISTASKSGLVKDILLYVPGESGTARIVVGHWACGGGEDQPRFGPAWFYWNGFDFHELRHAPTHWMPLPGPPDVSGGDELQTAQKPDEHPRSVVEGMERAAVICEEASREQRSKNGFAHIRAIREDQANDCAAAIREAASKLKGENREQSRKEGSRTASAAGSGDESGPYIEGKRGAD